MASKAYITREHRRKIREEIDRIRRGEIQADANRETGAREWQEERKGWRHSSSLHLRVEKGATADLVLFGDATIVYGHAASTGSHQTGERP